MKEEQFTCSVCGETLTEETKREFGGEIMCEHCFNKQTVECDCCHERIWRDDDNSGDENTPLCGACYDYYYTHCDICGPVVRPIQQKHTKKANVNTAVLRCQANKNSTTRYTFRNT